MKKCPFCAEEIQDEAIKCKHCGEMLDSQIKKRNEAVAKILLSQDVKQEAAFKSSGAAPLKGRSTVMDGTRIGCGMFIVLPLIIIGIFILFVIFLMTLPSHG